MTTTAFYSTTAFLLLFFKKKNKTRQKGISERHLICLTPKGIIQHFKNISFLHKGLMISADATARRDLA